MKLLPIMQTKPLGFSQVNQTNHTSVTFQANPKQYTKILEQGIKDAIGKTPELSEIMSNPKKKNMFMGLLSSLIVGAATTIVNLIDDSSDKDNTPKTDIKTSEDGDTIEIHATKQSENNPLNKIKKHKGKQAKHEVMLLEEIQKIISNQNLSIEEENSLTDFYNEFCSYNFKGKHYSSTNEELLNQQITENLISDLQNCNTKEKLTEIISFYQQYSKEPKENIKDVNKDAKKNEIPTNANKEIIQAIQNSKKLKEVYFKICNDENCQDQLSIVENFINEVILLQKSQDVKNIYLSKINTRYADYLLEIAKIYSEFDDNATQKQVFLSSLANKLVSMEALENWKNIKDTVLLNFNEYNSLININLDEAAIKSIAKLKRNAKIKNITVVDPNVFNICLTGTNVGKNFYIINNMFKEIHTEEYTPLKEPLNKKLTFDDIETEIRKNNSSYPNLSKYLIVSGKTYYNRGKMQDLLDLYNGNLQNKKLFTLHSYLRFIERVVLEYIDNSNETDDYIHCKTLTKNYIDSVVALKEGLKTLSKEPIEISTYEKLDIKAPQFEIPVEINNEKITLKITINENDKIHTLF